MNETTYDQTQSGPDFLNEQEPFDLFQKWLKRAEETEPNDPNAMSLATVDEDGLPNVRMVLLKGFDKPKGLFFTPTWKVPRGKELLGNPKAALCFHWKSLRRQIRVRGPLTQVSEDRSR